MTIPNVNSSLIQGMQLPAAVEWHRWLRTLEQAPPAWVRELADKSLSVGANSVAHGLPTTPTRWAVVADDARPALVRAYKSAAQSITGDDNPHTVIMDGETEDLGSDYNATTGVFTAPHAGLFEFNGCVAIDSLADGKVAVAGWSCSVAGVFLTSGVAVGSAASARLPLGFVTRLAEGETVSPVVAHNNAPNAPVGQTSVFSWISIRSVDGLAIASADATNLTVYSDRERTATIWAW